MIKFCQSFDMNSNRGFQCHVGEQPSLRVKSLPPTYLWSIDFDVAHKTNLGSLKLILVSIYQN